MRGQVVLCLLGLFAALSCCSVPTVYDFRDPGLDSYEKPQCLASTPVLLSSPPPLVPLRSSYALVDTMEQWNKQMNFVEFRPCDGMNEKYQTMEMSTADFFDCQSWCSDDELYMVCIPCELKQDNPSPVLPLSSRQAVVAGTCPPITTLDELPENRTVHCDGKIELFVNNGWNDLTVTAEQIVVVYITGGALLNNATLSATESVELNGSGSIPIELKNSYVQSPSILMQDAENILLTESVVVANTTISITADGLVTLEGTPGSPISLEAGNITIVAEGSLQGSYAALRAENEIVLDIEGSGSVISLEQSSLSYYSLTLTARQTPGIPGDVNPVFESDSVIYEGTLSSFNSSRDSDQELAEMIISNSTFSGEQVTLRASSVDMEETHFRGTDTFQDNTIIVECHSEDCTSTVDIRSSSWNNTLIYWEANSVTLSEAQFDSSAGNIILEISECQLSSYQTVSLFNSTIYLRASSSAEDVEGEIAPPPQCEVDGPPVTFSGDLSLYDSSSLITDFDFSRPASPALHLESLLMSVDPSSSFLVDLEVTEIGSQGMVISGGSEISRLEATVSYFISSNGEMDRIDLIDITGSELHDSLLHLQMTSTVDTVDTYGLSMDNSTLSDVEIDIVFWGEAARAIGIDLHDNVIFSPSLLNIDIQVDSTDNRSEVIGVQIDSVAYVTWNNSWNNHIRLITNTDSYALLVYYSDSISFTNMSIGVEVSSTSSSSAYGILVENPTAMTLDGVTWESTLNADAAIACYGVEMLEGWTELAGNVTFISSAEQGSSCYGIKWSDFNALHEGAPDDLVVEFDARGSDTGLLFYRSNLTILTEKLITYGQGSMHGVRTSQSSIGAPYWDLNGVGAVGLSSENGRPSVLPPSGLDWNFVATSTDAGGMSFYSVPSFYLPPTSSARFHLRTNSPTVVVGDLYMPWDQLHLEGEWDVQGNITILNSSVLSFANLVSEGDIWLTNNTYVEFIGTRLSAGGQITVEDDLMVLSSANLVTFQAQSISLRGLSCDFTDMGMSFLELSASASVELNSNINMEHLSVRAPSINAPLQVNCTGGFFVEGELNLLGSTAIIAYPFTLDGVMTPVDSAHLLWPRGEMIVLEGSEVTGTINARCFFNVTIRVDGTVHKILLEGNLLTGSGIVDSVIGGCGETGYIHPGVGETLQIGELNGSFIYVAEVSGSSSSQLQVYNRAEPLKIQFQFDTQLRASRRVVYPVLQPGDFFPMMDIMEVLYEEGEDPNHGRSSEVLSYLYEWNGIPTFSAHLNTPPQLTDDTLAVNCPCNASEYCINVISNDQDVDPFDTLEVTEVSDGWFVQSNSTVCFSRPASAVIDANAFYTVYDGHVSVTSGFVSMTFSSPYGPDGPPTPTSSPSKALLSTNSPSNVPPPSQQASTTPSPSGLAVDTPTPQSSATPTRSTLFSPGPSFSLPISFSRTPTARASPVILPPAATGNTSPSATRSPSRSRAGVTSTPTPSYTPLANIPGLCASCEHGFAEYSLNELYQSSGQTSGSIQIDLTMDNGRVVGSLEVPRQLIDSVREEEIILSIYTMTVDRFERGINGGQRIRSVVSDITLRSNLSEELITDLNESLTICLEAGEESGKDQCLGYYHEEKGKWECEDRCLDKKGDQYCGNTDHLTSFALLLGGGNRSCDNEFDRLVLWISLGFVGGAVILVILAAGLIEVYHQIRYRRQAQFLRKLSRSAQQL